MLRKHLYILLSGMVLFSSIIVEGQLSMPDNVCLGKFRHYTVNSNPGSTYTWSIDGVVQAGFTSNEFEHIWNISDTYLMEVQERSADGCLGPVRSGQVFVHTEQLNLIIPEAFSPNGDLVNDVWNIRNIDLYPNAEVTIYNRWGQTVWKSERGYHQPWDGKSNGINLPIDSYHYVIDLHKRLKPIIGEITIVR